MHGDRRWVELFERAGMPSVFESDMPLWLRCHAPLSIAFESIAVFGMRRNGGASWVEAFAVARALRGGFAIVEALGDRPVFVLAFLFWAISRVKSFRVLLASGKSECRALIDTMAAAASAKPATAEAVAALLAVRPSA